MYSTADVMKIEWNVLISAAAEDCDLDNNSFQGDSDAAETRVS